RASGPRGEGGGPTWPRPLPRRSPAVNGGSNTGCPTTDQRYQPRNDLGCDIGAYEFQDASIPTLTVPTGGITAAATSQNGAAVDYAGQVSASDPAGDPVTVSCVPPSGTVFPIGQTTVSCTASDNHNHTVTASFAVTVTNPGGVNCCASGKLSGRGTSVFAAAAAIFATGFQDDVC